MFSIGDTLLNNESMNIVYVIKNEDKLIKISQLFSDIYPNINYIKIPAWDCLPYDTASPSARVTGERINSFVTLSNDSKSIQLILITIKYVFKAITYIYTFYFFCLIRYYWLIYFIVLN